MAEGNGLLNRHRGSTPIRGSNPLLSAASPAAAMGQANLDLRRDVGTRQTRDGLPAPAHDGLSAHAYDGLIAQLDRASVYGTEGCWFEPS